MFNYRLLQDIRFNSLCYTVNPCCLSILCICCSVAQSHPTLCDPTDCSTPSFPVLHYLPELAQTHVHWVDDAIQPSHPDFMYSSSVQSFSRVRLCDPMNHSTPGLPIHHHLPEFTQTHIHRLVVPSSHLILCRPLLLLTPNPPSIRVFSSESVLCIW